MNCLHTENSMKQAGTISIFAHYFVPGEVAGLWKILSKYWLRDCMRKALKSERSVKRKSLAS